MASVQRRNFVKYASLYVKQGQNAQPTSITRVSYRKYFVLFVPLTAAEVMELEPVTDKNEHWNFPKIHQQQQELKLTSCIDIIPSPKLSV